MFRSALRLSVAHPRRLALNSPLPYVSHISPLSSPHSVCAFSSRASIPRLCPSCSQPLPTALTACNKCWHIEDSIDHSNYHKIFDLPSDSNPFVVDIPTLKHRFRQAQAVCHPDSWATHGPLKRAKAATLSSLINQAYTTLLLPRQRILYILSANGHELAEQDTITDMDFMEDIMETREAIRAADKTDGAVIADITLQNEAKIHDIWQEIESSVGECDWANAKEAAMKLTYLEGVKEAVKVWYDNNE